MSLKYTDYLAANPPQEVAALIKLVSIVPDVEAYNSLIAKELSTFPHFQQHKALLEAGHFTGQDFMQLLLATGSGKGTSTQAATALLQRLNEWSLVSDNGLFGPQMFARYHWNRQRISAFLSLGIVDNVVLGAAFVARKYRPSVPAIFVQKGGDKFTGTGFVTSLGNNAAKQVIVTARHNVDPAEGITFDGFSKPEGMTYMPLADDWILHPELDLALMPVKCSKPPLLIFALGNPAVLGRTMTLGYPRIATADGPYLLAHGGEVNALVKTYYGEDKVIISNIVAPGNSGGPVLDESGLCVGLVTNSLEAEHEGGVARANAAIPATAVHKFIEPYCS